MILKPFTIDNGGLPAFAVEFMGERKIVEPGQTSISIYGVNFPIDTNGYKGAKTPEPKTTPAIEVEDKDEPKEVAVKTTKRKSYKRKK